MLADRLYDETFETQIILAAAAPAAFRADAFRDDGEDSFKGYGTRDSRAFGRACLRIAL
jgi:hypothetical protein